MASFINKLRMGAVPILLDTSSRLDLRYFLRENILSLLPSTANDREKLVPDIKTAYN